MSGGYVSSDTKCGQFLRTCGRAGEERASEQGLWESVRFVFIY